MLRSFDDEQRARLEAEDDEMLVWDGDARIGVVKKLAPNHFVGIARNEAVRVYGRTTAEADQRLREVCEQERLRWRGDGYFIASGMR
jgi:hypothetical protein